MAGRNHELSDSELKQVIKFSQTEHAVMCGARAEDKVEAKAVKDGLLDADQTVEKIKDTLPASSGDVHSGGGDNDVGGGDNDDGHSFRPRYCPIICSAVNTEKGT